MKIATDLEGTLIAECGEGARVEAAALVPRCQATRAPRHHAGAGQATGAQEPPKTAAALLQRPQGAGTEPLWKSQRNYLPPCQSQDLLLDDEPRHIQVAWRSGVKGVLVTNREQDGTAHIREAALQSPEIEIITLQKKATL